MAMTKHLYLTGDQETLQQLRELAIEAGLCAYWVKERKRAMPSRQYRSTHGPSLKSETRLGKLLLATMRTMPMREWNLEDLGIAVEEMGYKATSTSPMMSYLAREGFVNRVAENTFQLTNFGRGDPPMQMQKP